jgi:hypothetical protein
VLSHDRAHRSVMPLCCGLRAAVPFCDGGAAVNAAVVFVWTPGDVVCLLLVIVAACVVAWGWVVELYGNALLIYRWKVRRTLRYVYMALAAVAVGAFLWWAM